jgi:hypothetical protein
MTTNSLVHPLDSFEYEQADILQLFNEQYSSLRQQQTPKHIGSKLIEQEFLEKNFPLLSNSIKQLIHNDDKFFGRFFLTLPRSKGDIHIDLRKERTLVRDWSLNIPIENCENTYQEWYDTHNDPYTELNYNAFFWRNNHSGTLIYKYELSVPTILKVSIPHRINNPLDTCRIVMAIRTESNTFK